MKTYLERYEALQQERLRNRRQRASEQFFSPSVSAISDQLGESFDRALDLFPSNRYEQEAADSAQYQQQYQPQRHENAYEQAHDAWRSAVNEHAHNMHEDTHANESPNARDEHEHEHEHNDDHEYDNVYDTDRDEQDHPVVDAFDDALRGQQQHALTTSPSRGPASVASDEFVDAATYLEANPLGGGGNDDSFDHDVALQTQTQMNWPLPDESVLTNGSGRPSDFFERRSRSLERVEFALHDETEPDSSESRAEMADSVARAGDRHDAKRSASSTATAAAAPPRPSARQQSSLSFSDTNTAFSSGYDVHFDSARQMFTPNSLKYLQDKASVATPIKPDEAAHELDGSTHHERQAERDLARPRLSRPVTPDVDACADELPESIRAMQRGPGLIVEALHEIDALIMNPPVRDGRAGASARRGVHDIVREYDLSLENGLPLSRTTDSWGDDPDDDLRDEPASTSPRARDPLRVHRSDHVAELSPISEMRTSAVSSTVEPPTPLFRITEEGDTSVSSAHTGETLPSLSRARHEADASALDAQQFASRQSVASAVGDVSSALQQTRRDGTMESAELANGHRDGASTPKKWSSSVRFSDGIRDGDVDAPEQSAQTGLPSPVKTRSDGEHPQSQQQQQQRHFNGHAQHLQLSQQRHARTPMHSRAASTAAATTGSIRDSRGRDIDGANAARRRESDGASERLLPRKPTTDSEATNIAFNPIQLARRCRRLLCAVGETMTERIVFANGSDAVGRICVSLLPLSTGCQQFAVSPAVLEIEPRASSSFHVTFTARTAGVAAGIFQFRGVGLDALLAPYEVLLEASVRPPRALEAFDVPSHVPRIVNSVRAREIEVEELRRSRYMNDIEIGPMFVKFERATSRSGVKAVAPATLTIANNTDAPQPFSITCAHEHLKISPSSGRIAPASVVTVSLVPLARPVEQRRSDDSVASFRRDSSAAAVSTENWTGSFTVSVGSHMSREVSFVLSAAVLQSLPPFDAIARSRHQLSSQTDAFYYTKKRNRRGLYFHARAVECGSCNVGESHQVPVYICNGSSAPMTVFLQDLMEPFSCAYATTTIEARKFIEVAVTFTPKVAGKVSTSLFAYSVTDKAVVTLVARGT